MRGTHIIDDGFRGIMMIKVSWSYLLWWCAALVQATDIPITAGDNLQAKLNAAKPGDVFLLKAGATWIGPIMVPNIKEPSMQAPSPSDPRLLMHSFLLPGRGSCPQRPWVISEGKYRVM